METQRESSLKKQVSRSVVYLSLRRIVSTVLATVGTLFIARILGPEVQGLFATALGIQTYAMMVGLIGVRPYLIQSQSTSQPSQLHLAFCFELLYSLVLVGVLGVAGGIWYLVSRHEVPLMLLTLALTLPASMTREVPLAVLENRFEYQKSALIETVSQGAYYALAIALVLLGWGAWALVIGYVVSEYLTALGFFWAARYRPRWYWDRVALRPMLAYGVTFALSDWAKALQKLVPPLIVFPTLGAAAVGYIGMAEKLVASLYFVVGAVGRAVFPAFSRIQNDKARLVRAVEQGVPLQMLGLGALYGTAAFLLPYVAPALLGAKWDATLISGLFAFLSVSSFVSALTALEGAVLFATGKNMLVFYYSLAGSLMFGLTAFLLLNFAPEFWGVYAYGVASAASTATMAFFRHFNFRRYVGKPDYTLALVWFAAACSVVAAPVVSEWLYGVSLILLLAFPQSRRALRENAQKARALLKRKGSSRASTPETDT
ncbi:MAG: oligosaccharide flippase family protein [Armatimonadetes bacterium]|nr:oligosaccharide flippase family protein [Armatimonadota bacterium]CUU38035.1 polysaccharide transporter, PST family [Armatimonadetes bacterium DC]